MCIASDIISAIYIVDCPFYISREEAQILRLAVKIEGDDAQGYYNLARAFEVLHIYADAVQNYDRAAEMMPESKAVRDDRVLCMERLERSIDLA